METDFHVEKVYADDEEKSVSEKSIAPTSEVGCQTVPMDAEAMIRP